MQKQKVFHCIWMLLGYLTRGHVVNLGQIQKNRYTSPNMQTEFLTLMILLGILWFLVFWIFGGVFFAVLTLIRLGRIRKVRFSCLFTCWALLCAAAAAYYGVHVAEQPITQCLEEAVTRSETVSAVFVCGFWGIFGVGAGAFAALLSGGLGIFFVSRSGSKEWVHVETE